MENGETFLQVKRSGYNGVTSLPGNIVFPKDAVSCSPEQGKNAFGDQEIILFRTPNPF